MANRKKINGRTFDEWCEEVKQEWLEHDCENFANDDGFVKHIAAFTWSSVADNDADDLLSSLDGCYETLEEEYRYYQEHRGVANTPKLAGIRITNIDWCVEDEDVITELYDWEDVNEIDDDVIKEKIEEIRAGLPTEEFIPANKQNLGAVLNDVSDWLSDKYGWLVNSFSYNLVDDGGKVLV